MRRRRRGRDGRDRSSSIHCKEDRVKQENKLTVLSYLRL